MKNTTTKEIKLNNKETIFLITEKLAFDNFIIKAYNLNEENVASLFFSFNEKVCYLHRIEIKIPNYSHLNLGSMLLKEMECLAKDQNCNVVEGKFYPFGELGKHAQRFYLKNGYEIIKDDFQTYIYKNIFLSKQHNEPEK